MEEILCFTLELRFKKLQEDVGKAKTCLSADQILQDDLVAAQTSLKHNLEHFSLELNNFIEKVNNPDVTVIKNYLSQKMEFESVLIKMNSLLNQHKTSNPNQEYQARLPKLDIGKYDGNILNWTSFWDKFRANVDSRNISEVEKLSYLVTSLEGLALETVEGLGTTNLNYNVAVDLLKTRFGETQRVIDAHNEALHSLSKAGSSATSCRHTLNIIEKHLRVLECMGEDISGNHLRVILLGKFPENVLYQTSLLTVNDSSVAAIRKALDTVIIAMERAGPTEALNVKPVETKESKSIDALQVRVENKPRKRKWNKTKNDSRDDPPTKKKSCPNCSFCDKPHYSEDCLTYTSYKDRKQKLRKDKRCFRCFRIGHIASNCRAKLVCVHCKRGHNRALCFHKTKKTTTDKGGSTSLHIDERILTNITTYNFLQMAVTKIKTPDKTLTSRLLLDSGSQRSYITTRLAKDLKIVPDREDHLTIYTFGCNKPKEISSPSAEITLLTKRLVQRNIRVNIVPHITDRIPVIKLDTSEIIDIVADDDSKGTSVDLLIGNDFYFSFIRANRFKVKEHAYLVDSDFGWILSGHIEHENELSALSVSTYCQCHEADCPYFTEPDLPLRSIDIKFLWTLESIGIVDSPKATREEDVVKFFNETTVYKSGRYEVKWPWIQYPPELPTNFGLAFGRLKSLLKRSDKETIDEYNDILKEQLQTNIIEVVDPGLPPDRIVHYLPHHMVKQENKRGRLVYDASAKTKDNKSLNECLYSGPSMLEDLVGLLLKFRTGKVGVTADVEKAFLQVGLQEEDRDVTRFLWIKDPHKELDEDNLIHYRFCRVPFGIISSPFLLTATIRLHMSKKNESLLRSLGERCYVDNLVTAVGSTRDALQLYHTARSIFNDMSMNIRDWMSNDVTFLESIPGQQRAKQTDKMKILGLTWNLKHDTLQLNFNKINTVAMETTTKRDVLRIIARIYDPCGFASPLILPAKLLFQELCDKKLSWDSPLTEDLHGRWKFILKNLESAIHIEVPRNICIEKRVHMELHCFTDASKLAYASVVYLRAVGSNKVETTFLMSKSRVTPMEDKQDLKIPRLELLAYLIGSRLLQYTRRYLEVQVSKIYLWTDSQIVLAWMKSNKLLPPFVSRRVNEIKDTQRSLGEIELRYVHTKSNPADIATREDLWDQKQNLWFHGPDFLRKKEDCWPTQKIDADKILLSVGQGLDMVDGPEMTMKGYEIDIEENSHDAEGQSPEEAVPIDHLNEIRKLQREYFPDEVDGKETSLSRNLGLFLDVDGILRCKGRFANAKWSYEKRYPVLLPKDSDFTNNVIRKMHEENYHVGVSHVLSLLREKYWIPQGRAQVQRILKKCPQCIKYGGGPYTLPPTPALPMERVNYSNAFTFTGLDYLGPLYIKTDNGKEKRWVCLLTCLAVRAIHLELVKDLTAEECLLALRRFTASRGVPKVIVSDNALQFKLTSEVLTSSYCTTNLIKWRFIPQLAPWHGGFYERLVALVKHCLKRTIDKHLLNECQLLTVIKEVESVVNTRPLTAIGSELEEVLRPADFLTMGRCLELTPTNEGMALQGTDTKIDLIKGWKRGHMIVNEYKKMFINQYLPSLRERYNHSCKQPRVKSHREPQLGDIVQIKDDSKSRVNWKVGKIVTLIRGMDGQCRVAKVKVGESEFTRSIGHLYPLEIGTSEKEVHPNCPPLSDYSPPAVQVYRSPPEDVPQQSAQKEDEPMELDLPAASDPKDDTSRAESETFQDGAVPEVLVPLEDQLSPSLDAEMTEVTPLPENEVEGCVEATRERRGAAIRAREKIAEWTRQLLSLL